MKALGRAILACVISAALAYGAGMSTADDQVEEAVRVAVSEVEPVVVTEQVEVTKEVEVIKEVTAPFPQSCIKAGETLSALNVSLKTVSEAGGAIQGAASEFQKAAFMTDSLAMAKAREDMASNNSLIASESISAWGTLLLYEGDLGRCQDDLK